MKEFESLLGKDPLFNLGGSRDAEKRYTESLHAYRGGRMTM